MSHPFLRNLYFNGNKVKSQDAKNSILAKPEIGVMLEKPSPISIQRGYMKAKLKIPKGFRLIFRASKTVNGVKLYARDFGLRGFPILIPIN